jgi:AcrR family transcriptional regulator
MAKKREAEILRAGVEVFSEKGYAATTIQDIADRVGVLKGSLYYYIDSKEDLLFRIGCETNAGAAAILHEVQELDTAPLDRLQIYLTRYLEWYLNHFEVVSLYLSEWVNLTGERRAEGIKLRHEFEDFIRAQIELAQSTGEVASDLNPRLASFAILGAVNSVSSWWNPSRYSVPDVARSYARMAVGLAVGYGKLAAGAQTGVDEPASDLLMGKKPPPPSSRPGP